MTVSGAGDVPLWTPSPARIGASRMAAFMALATREADQLGLAVAVFDDAGNPLIGERGELVCTLNGALVRPIRSRVRERLTPRHVPARLHQVPITEVCRGVGPLTNAATPPPMARSLCQNARLPPAPAPGRA